MSLVSGQLDSIATGVRRLVARNPGYMTGPGTNTYLLGNSPFAAIDPGPEDPVHIERILTETRGSLETILATHTHPDHSPAARTLSEKSGAIVLGRPAPQDGRQDADFAPARVLADGDIVQVGDLLLRAIHTPGHASNHLCFLLEGQGLLFTGDHLMQGSTVVIAPPDGNMAEYLASLERLRTMRPALRSIAPGHGHLIEEPGPALAELIAHRLERERQVLATLEELGGKATPAALVDRIYTDLVEELVPRARQTVHAHLRKLRAEGRVATKRPDDEVSTWVLSNTPS